MFATLSDRLAATFKNLRGKGKLSEADIDATVREINPGPAVTQYALEPGNGVKVRRITELQNDLALALAAHLTESALQRATEDDRLAAALQRTLDYACGHGADCEALRPGGQCHVPNTLLAYCSYAANS